MASAASVAVWRKGLELDEVNGTNQANMLSMTPSSVYNFSDSWRAWIRESMKFTKASRNLWVDLDLEMRGYSVIFC